MPNHADVRTMPSRRRCGRSPGRDFSRSTVRVASTAHPARFGASNYQRARRSLEDIFLFLPQRMAQLSRPDDRRSFRTGIVRGTRMILRKTRMKTAFQLAKVLLELQMTLRTWAARQKFRGCYATET